MIEVKDITKSYGDTHAVNGISFSIKAGECYGLLGPNGAVKSTTINMLSTLFMPDTGEIILDGKNVKNASEEVKQILGIVPQEIALYENLTAWENMLFWGSIYGVKGSVLLTKASDLLKWVGLEDRKQEKIKGYSGGMKRRINLACALMHSPKILLLDEPTVGVDPQSRNLIFELIQELNKQGMTTIYTTHYMEEAEKLCNRIGIIDCGKIIAQGTLDELKTQSGINDVVFVECTQEPDEKKLAERLNAQVVVQGNNAQIIGDDAGKNLTRYVVACADAGYEITHIDVRKANLEGVFLKMTGKKLRD
ncbi:MAG: ABC transporter ATP-binding protein [Bacteroidia bacterium]|nr:ABC transporter ATP-binding protein [Bacteroidia bacterium]